MRHELLELTALVLDETKVFLKQKLAECNALIEFESKENNENENNEKVKNEKRQKRKERILGIEKAVSASFAESSAKLKKGIGAISAEIKSKESASSTVRVDFHLNRRRFDAVLKNAKAVGFVFEEKWVTDAERRESEERRRTRRRTKKLLKFEGSEMKMKN